MVTFNDLWNNYPEDNSPCRNDDGKPNFENHLNP